MEANWSRRAFLGSFSTACLGFTAGCISSSGGPARGATDLHFYNEADVSRTVDVSVTERSNESPTVDTHFEIEPNDYKKINNEVIMGNTYDVFVEYIDTTRDSPYSETQEWDNAEQALHIILTDQIVFTLGIG